MKMTGGCGNRFYYQRLTIKGLIPHKQDFALGMIVVIALEDGKDYKFHHSHFNQSVYQRLRAELAHGYKVIEAEFDLLNDKVTRVELL